MEITKVLDRESRQCVAELLEPYRFRCDGGVARVKGEEVWHSWFANEWARPEELAAAQVLVATLEPGVADLHYHVNRSPSSHKRYYVAIAIGTDLEEVR